MKVEDDLMQGQLFWPDGAIAGAAAAGAGSGRRRVARHAAPTVIDLFCGCGGLSKGFLDAGYQVLLGIDSDHDALKTYDANIKGAKGMSIDLFDFSYTSKISALLAGRPVDVVVAGPPCQGFSLTGPRKFDDDRNRLYLAVFEAVRVLRPKAVVIENVKGMKTLYNGEIKDEIVRRFRELGYSMPEPKILCAADYGVPQIRERLFFVGLRNDLGQFDYPHPSHSSANYITCEEAIGDLPGREDDQGSEEDVHLQPPKLSSYQKKMRGNQKGLFNHVATRHTEYVKSVISQVPEGGNYKNLPPGIGESRKFNEAWTRYHSGKPSRTIDTGHRNHFHYKHHRVPTIRENARLQSFPDDFVFLGTRTKQNKQVGNAVPPLLAEAIATHLLKYIRRKP
jgi:DNA (cytosine-5)-methyltransferase 1